jgi:hypothetical protein
MKTQIIALAFALSSRFTSLKDSLINPRQKEIDDYQRCITRLSIRNYALTTALKVRESCYNDNIRLEEDNKRQSIIIERLEKDNKAYEAQIRAVAQYQQDFYKVSRNLDAATEINLLLSKKNTELTEAVEDLKRENEELNEGMRDLRLKNADLEHHLCYLSSFIESVID